MTWLDFVVACEIHQMCESYQTRLPDNYELLQTWYEKMIALPAMAEVCDKLDAILNEHNLKSERPSNESIQRQAA